MDKAGVAEWMLARRFGEQRANEMVGDLLEQHKSMRFVWQILRLALGVRIIELAGLLLVSLAVEMIQSAVYSAWSLHFMQVQENLHIGWAWSMCSLLGGIAFTSWRVTASAAWRLGTKHGLTRSSFTFSVTLLFLSGFMLQPELRRISPMILTAILLWRLYAGGLVGTFSCIAATGAAFESLRWLSSAVQLKEIQACVVQMHSRFQPTWSTFYSACTPQAAHTLLNLFMSSLLSFWLLIFLPSSPQRGALQKTV